MRLTIFLFSLLMVVSCGADKKSKPRAQNQEDQNTEVIHSCEEKSLKCSLPTQYVIVSKQTLPKKMKVYFKTSEKRTLVFDQCNTKSVYQRFPSEGVTTIGFRENSEVFLAGMDLEIVDAGEDCDNDALFFDRAITPVDSDSWVNARATRTFTLDN